MKMYRRRKRYEEKSLYALGYYMIRCVKRALVTCHGTRAFDLLIEAVEPDRREALEPFFAATMECLEPEDRLVWSLQIKPLTHAWFMTPEKYRPRPLEFSHWGLVRKR